jgi:hypothetical protein
MSSLRMNALHMAMMNSDHENDRDRCWIALEAELSVRLAGFKGTPESVVDF